MKSLLNTIVGAVTLLYLFYIVIESFRLVFGWSDLTVNEMVSHYAFIGFVVFIMMIGSRYKAKITPLTQHLETSSKNTSFLKKAKAYNPYEDNIHLEVYQLHEPAVGLLRFYKDGVVLGNYTNTIPKIALADSYDVKGTWELNKNKVRISLEQTNNFNNTSVSPKTFSAGTYTGTVKGEHIKLGKFHFYKADTSTLIITASDRTCSALNRKLQNHPSIIDTFEDTGFWYTNGETGPEWFTIHIKTLSKNTTTIENLVSSALSDLNLESGNQYWS